MEPLVHDAGVRQAIATAVTPLVVHAVCTSLWGVLEGEGATAQEMDVPIQGALSPEEGALAMGMVKPLGSQGFEPQLIIESLTAGEEGMRLHAIQQQHDLAFVEPF